MSSLKTNERKSLAILQNQYRHAWQQFMMDVETLQSILDNNSFETDSVTQARLQVEQSACFYRDARNALALYLLSNQPVEPEEYVVEALTEVAC